MYKATARFNCVKALDELQGDINHMASILTCFCRRRSRVTDLPFSAPGLVILVTTITALHHLQHLAFLQRLDIFRFQRILLVKGVRFSLRTSSIGDLECISTNLATMPVSFGVLLML